MSNASSTRAAAAMRAIMPHRSRVVVELVRSHFTDDARTFPLKTLGHHQSGDSGSAWSISLHDDLMKAAVAGVIDMDFCWKAIDFDVFRRHRKLRRDSKRLQGAFNHRSNGSEPLLDHLLHLLSTSSVSHELMISRHD